MEKINYNEIDQFKQTWSPPQLEILDNKKTYGGEAYRDTEDENYDTYS